MSDCTHPFHTASTEGEQYAIQVDDRWTAIGWRCPECGSKTLYDANSDDPATWPVPEPHGYYKPNIDRFGPNGNERFQTNYVCNMCEEPADMAPFRYTERTRTGETFNQKLSRTVETVVYACHSHYHQVSIALCDEVGGAYNSPADDPHPDFVRTARFPIDDRA